MSTRTQDVQLTGWAMFAAWPEGEFDAELG